MEKIKNKIMKTYNKSIEYEEVVRCMQSFMISRSESPQIHYVF